jgi:hypothetical protein
LLDGAGVRRQGVLRPLAAGTAMCNHENFGQTAPPGSWFRPSVAR